MVHFEKIIPALGLAKQVFWPQLCVNKIFWLNPSKKSLPSLSMKKNVCPLSMKIKCLPSIHDGLRYFLSYCPFFHMILDIMG